MPTTTPNYGLTVYNATTDGAETFIDFRTDIAGPSASNMTIIDDSMADLQDQIDSLDSTKGAIPVNGTYSSPNYYLATTALIAAYATDMLIVLKLDTTSNGIVTININSLGTRTLKKYSGTGVIGDLVGNDLIKNRSYLFRYDGTYWVWVSPNSADQISATGTAGNLISITDYGLADSGIATGNLLTVTQVQPRNLLMNGGFDLVQRGNNAVPDTTESGSVVSGIGPDRWKIQQDTALDSICNRASATSEVGLTSKYYATFQPQTAKKILISQAVESFSAIPLRGKIVTFQVSMKASSAKTIRMGVIEGRTSADTARWDIVGTWNGASTDPTLAANLYYNSTAASKSVTTSWATYSVSFTVPTTCLNLYVAVWSDSAFTAYDVLYLAEASLFVGNYTIPWNPRLIQQEISDRQRYYEKSYAIDTAPGTDLLVDVPGIIAISFSSSDIAGCRFSVKKRDDPAVIIYSDSGAQDSVYKINGATDVALDTASFKITRDGISIITSVGTFTTGLGYSYFFTASAEL